MLHTNQYLVDTPFHSPSHRSMISGCCWLKLNSGNILSTKVESLFHIDLQSAFSFSNEVPVDFSKADGDVWVHQRKLLTAILCRSVASRRAIRMQVAKNGNPWQCNYTSHTNERPVNTTSSDNRPTVIKTFYGTSLLFVSSFTIAFNSECLLQLDMCNPPAFGKQSLIYSWFYPDSSSS